jgi:hypothetical protein
VGVGLLIAAAAHAQSDITYRTLAASRQAVDETDFSVVVRFGLGTFRFAGDPGNALYRTTLTYIEEAFEPEQEYDKDEHRLRIGLSEGPGNRNFNIRNLRELEQRLEVNISPTVPTRIDLEFGAVSADIDLGGLSLLEAEVQTGASEGTLRFSEPTRTTCERLDFEIGAADFSVEQIGNSNCAEMEFQGGAGRFTLDFTGEWQRGGDTRASVDIGVGALTLRFPSHLGVAVTLDRLLATFDRSGFVKRGDVYYSSNFEESDAKLILDINAVLGDINVVWLPR